MSQAGTLEKQNITEIRDTYRKSMNTVIKKLKMIEPDMKEFCTHVITIFEEDDIAGCISDTTDIHRLSPDTNSGASETLHSLKALLNISLMKMPA